MIKDLYSQYIHKSRYARFVDSKGRREHWEETVDRYINYMQSNILEKYKFDDPALFKKLRDAIYNMEIMPSMRAMMTAGKALDRDHTSGYNCSFLPVDDPKAFDEAMHILMCGTGVGFSVERQYINRLPEVPDKLFDSDIIIIVKDSKEGWSKALRQVIALLYTGEIPKWDLTKLRPAGAPLKTFGGRSSGPEPLEDLFRFLVKIFRNAAGRRLTSLECHDIMCKIGEVVVVGGVRRCLPEGSLVHTKTGMTPIEDIKIGELVLTSNGYRKVTRKFDQGMQKLVRVQTQDSYFDCTYNHKIAVLTSCEKYVWKKASELEFGDRLIAPSVGLDGKETNLPLFVYEKPKHSTTCRDITIPSLDDNMAWFLGIVQGDGYVRLTSKSGEVCIACTKDYPEIIDKTHQQLQRFGVVTTQVNYDNYVVVRAKSKQLAAYLHSWLKQPKQELHVPYFIWDASRSLKLSFVSGLMAADGSNKTRPPQICCTVYEKYAKEIQLLLSSCGIQTRIKHLSETNLENGWQKKYAVVAVNNKAKTALNACTNMHKKIDISLSEQRTNSYTPDMLNFTYPNNYPWSKTDYALIPVAVVSVELLDDVRPTWDIEVEEMHEFFCEGYLMHNSAMISLSNLSDDRMRNAKAGAWWEAYGHRTLSNNSAVYTEKPDIGLFMQEWLSLYESKSGERGIFNREASKLVAKKNGRRDPNHEFGTNPCSEIILRPYEFCNLTEVIVRAEDTEDDLERKVALASILGTFQSTLTHFPYLRKIWQKNTEEERLLGVSLTGIYDNKILNNYKDKKLGARLEKLRDKAVETNKELAGKLGIPASAAVTCVKPSGTVSQLTDSASGIHPRHDPYYFRRVRSDNKDPLTKYLTSAGIPAEPDVTKPGSTTVFTFPKKAPKGALVRSDISAIDHLELWLVFQTHWCEHKPSVTISVKENEWLAVGAWVWEHFDEISGVSFLPWDGGSYRQAPYETVTEDQYKELLVKLPQSIDWDALIEHEDNVEGIQTLACSAAAGCEL